jgi:hypothetical protein
MDATRSTTASRKGCFILSAEASLLWDGRKSATKGAGWRLFSRAVRGPFSATPAPLLSGVSGTSSVVWWRSPYPALLGGVALAFGFIVALL